MLDDPQEPYDENVEASSENQRAPDQPQEGAEVSRNPALHQPFLQYFGAHPPSGPSSHAINAQAHLSASQSTLDPQSDRDDGADQQAKPKRNPRQQEQNKQAQQRYRAKRKAQFEEMQGAVAALSRQVLALQQEKQSSRQLEAELARMQALLAEKEQALQALPMSSGHGSATANAVAAAAADRRGASPSPLPPTLNNLASLASPADAAGGGGVARQVWQDGRAASAGLVSGGHAAHPSSDGRPRSRMGGPPLHSLSAGGAAAASGGSGGSGGEGAGASGPPLQLTPALVQHALQMYYQDLQYHASLCHLEQLHPGGLDASPATMRELHRLLQAGSELIRMVLQASGPGAKDLIMGVAAGAASSAHSSSPADSHQLWQQVAMRLQLTKTQVREIGVWRERFVQQLDELYGRRLLLKAQVVQMTAALGGMGADPATSGAAGEGKGGGDEQPQWAESLLLQSVSDLGYSASALAAVELDELVSGLRQNVRQEREMAGGMMQALLTQVLTPVQAARYLLAGHPFTWNGLAFAHALAAMQQPPQPPAASAPL